MHRWLHPEGEAAAGKIAAGEDDGWFDYAGALINCRDTLSDAASMSYWEYTAVLSEWNRRRSAEQAGDTDVKAPSAERVRKNHERLRRAGLTEPRVH